MRERYYDLVRKNKSLGKDSLKIKAVLKNHFGLIVKVNDTINILINERQELESKNHLVLTKIKKLHSEI
jgi:hypothetical protein